MFNRGRGGGGSDDLHEAIAVDDKVLSSGYGEQGAQHGQLYGRPTLLPTFRDHLHHLSTQDPPSQ